MTFLSSPIPAHHLYFSSWILFKILAFYFPFWFSLSLFKGPFYLLPAVWFLLPWCLPSFWIPQSCALDYPFLLLIWQCSLARPLDRYLFKRVRSCWLARFATFPLIVSPLILTLLYYPLFAHNSSQLFNIGASSSLASLATYH